MNRLEYGDAYVPTSAEDWISFHKLMEDNNIGVYKTNSHYEQYLDDYRNGCYTYQSWEYDGSCIYGSSTHSCRNKLSREEFLMKAGILQDPSCGSKLIFKMKL